MHEFKKGDVDYHNDLNDNFKECLVKSDILNLFYPVGAIFQSFKNTDPSTLFGGTWERIKGKVLVGVDENDSDFASGKTGGEKSHKLTVGEMPSHTHSIAGGSFAIKVSASAEAYGTAASSAYILKSTPTTAAAGSDSAHNNLQPYQTIYMWKRTA